MTYNFFDELQRITRAHLEISGLPVKPMTPNDSLAVARAASAPSVDSPCFACGSSNDPLAECSGCRAARIAEARADRERDRD